MSKKTEDYLVLPAIISAIIWLFTTITVAVLCFVILGIINILINKQKTNKTTNDGITKKNFWLQIEDFCDLPVDISSGAGSYMDMFKLEVVGESNYQQALKKLVPDEAKQTNKHHVYYIASLELEDNNEYDKNAIAIEVQGLKVGYIPKESNKALRKQLSSINKNKQSFSCKAVIIGGDNKYYGVWLDI